jgi:hypothetical protein
VIVFSLWEQTTVSFHIRTTHRAQLSSCRIRPLNITSFNRWIFRLSSTTSNVEVFKVTVVYIYRVVRTVTRLRAGRPRNRGSIPGSGNRILSSPKRPDRLWGSSNFLYNGYCRLSLLVQRWGVRLTTPFHLIPTLRVGGAIPLRPLYAYIACTGTFTFTLTHTNVGGDRSVGIAPRYGLQSPGTGSR